MKNLIKKNQLMITALAIMIAIAGYLQFAGTGLEEEYLTVNDDVMYKDVASAAGSGDIITENYTAGDLLDLSADGLLDLSDEDLLNAGYDIDSMDSDLEGNYVEDYLSGMELQEVGTDGAQNPGSTPNEGEIPGEVVFTSSRDVTVVLSEAKLLREQTRAKNKESLMDIINSAELSDETKQDAINTLIKMTEIAEKEAAAEILLEAKGYSDVVVSINGNAVDVVVNASSLDEVKLAQIEDIVKRKTEIPAENIIISTVVR